MMNQETAGADPLERDWHQSSEQAAFDGLAMLAALAINAPMAMIAVFDREAFCLKSKFGPIEGEEDHFNLSPFAELLCSPQPIAIANFKDCSAFPDLPRLPLFRKVHSLIAAPIFGNGSKPPVGAVFALDFSPRQFGPDQLLAISSVAHAASNELRLQCTPLSMKDEFFALVAHELKTPICSVSMILQLLLRNAKKHVSIPSEKILRSIETARRQTDSLNRLVEKLLDLSRLSRGELVLDLEKVELAGLVKDVAARLQSLADCASCPLSVSADCAVEGEWDRTRLEQVLTNLITNALKYGAKKPIHVCVQADGRVARVQVQDSGIGIATEDLSTIFQRFGRATKSHRSDSMGLGLYISHEIAKAHGGNINVKSEPGNGSVFTLELPLQNQPSARAAPELKIV